MWFIYVKRSGGRAAYRTHPSGRCRLDLQKKIINSIIVQWRGESKAYIQLFCVCKLWYRLLIVKYYISHILLQVLLSFAISEWRTKKLYHKVSKVTFKNRIIRVVYWKYFDFFLSDFIMYMKPHIVIFYTDFFFEKQHCLEINFSSTEHKTFY